MELYVKPEALAYLERLKQELRFVFLTSEVTLTPTDTWPENALSSDDGHYAVRVHKTTEKKCARCWHHVIDVGTHQDHPEICGRCVENLYAEGEKRLFV